MRGRNWARVLEVILVSLTAAAIIQELRKPDCERTWHGKVFGILPYEFRRPTLDRLREVCWNPYERRVIVPNFFGLGWSINLYSLLENLGLVRQEMVTEDDFLMPNKRMRQILKQSRAST